MLDSDDDDDDEERESVGLLVNFFKLKKEKSKIKVMPSEIPKTELFVDIKHYSKTVPSPQFDKNGCFYPINIGKSILSLIKTNI